ncbi:copper homeostasis protein CutC [Oceanomicrobium pacificus]|uniref:PF03932 family protein CutC n=1 Tax=Oceanomicrobium pacificus TaxID=2692916 RepID=A0A6B0U0G4_9RHOB|nr:copper homeostasis protein CutC [Oceanomicrobium pacificus]MXU66733.1 copper homeostasis protein CutC [Oceanomicrobium pacificus]
MTRPLLEICVDTIEGAWVAVEAGADRIELCSALAIGGLTPSAGLMRAAADLPVPCHAMIRPRGGHFLYSPGDVAAMLDDIGHARDAGLAGIVTGALTEARALDVAVLRDLLAARGSMQATLHRAVDLVPDASAAVEAAIALGFDRILTSGGAARVGDGLPRLAQMADAARGRIEIMPGGGVTPALAPRLLALPGIDALHASGAAPVSLPATLFDGLGFEAEGQRREAHAPAIRALRDAMDELERNCA